MTERPFSFPPAQRDFSPDSDPPFLQIRIPTVFYFFPNTDKDPDLDPTKPP